MHITIINIRRKTMKKLFAVLMAMAMVVSMAACAAPAETEAAPSAEVEMKYMTCLLYTSDAADD